MQHCNSIFEDSVLGQTFRPLRSQLSAIRHLKVLTPLGSWFGMGHSVIKVSIGVILLIVCSFSVIPTWAQSGPVVTDPPSSFPQPRLHPLRSELPQAFPPYLPPELTLPPELRTKNPEVALRYYVDVTTYGAKSDRYFDNTAAIQAAINAGCMGGPFTQLKTVLYFPPGYYVIHQPQQPSTSPALTIPCSLEMEGAWNAGGSQFSIMAQGTWIQTDMGDNPNAAAAMAFVSHPPDYPSPILRHLSIVGANQAVAIYGVQPSIFDSVCLTAQKTGLPDNTALKVTDAIWLYYKGGCLETPIGVPVAIFTAEELSYNPTAEQLDGLVYMSDMITDGGGFQYIQRSNGNGGGPGNFVFRNITMEDVDDIFSISQTCPSCPNWQIISLTFDHVGSSDSPCPTCSVVNINTPGGIVSGININHGFAGGGGWGRAITIQAGRLQYHSVNSCAGCVTAILDGNGDPVWNYTGKVTLSGGTKTVNFYPVYFAFAPPVCVTNDETRINGSNITTSLTSMTISGGDSDVVDYACYVDDPYPVGP
jgi:hypothetical protein